MVDICYPGTIRQLHTSGQEEPQQNVMNHGAMQDINFGMNKSTGLHVTNSSAPESARKSTTDPDATHFPPWNFLGGGVPGTEETKPTGHQGTWDHAEPRLHKCSCLLDVFERRQHRFIMIGTWEGMAMSSRRMKAEGCKDNDTVYG